jgi:hypothetical protein
MNTNTKAIAASEVFAIASAMSIRNGSALACLQDANAAYASQWFDSCIMWSLRCIAHEVGKLHPIYKHAESLAK